MIALVVIVIVLAVNSTSIHSSSSTIVVFDTYIDRAALGIDRGYSRVEHIETDSVVVVP